MSVDIIARGLADMQQYFDQFPTIASEAAAMAINEVSAGVGLTAIRRDMRSEIEFPSGYLEGDRLKLQKRATPTNLEAIIRGRDRPTSLARFASGQTPSNTRGRPINVRVKKGRVRSLKRAFMVNLKNGNVGVAVRLKEGEELEKTDGAIRLVDNVYLLYGPSVEQVFRGVATDNTPFIADSVRRRFVHHFSRRVRRG